MKYKFLITSILLVGIFLFKSETFSQTNPDVPVFNPLDLINQSSGLPQGIEEQISIDQDPEIPMPDEFVSIRIESFMTDLNKAKITWTQDGEILLSQIGAITNQIQAPESGKSSTIVISIIKENGGIFSKTIILSPADVDLIYEAQTYAHPFFKGKKLYTSESVVNVIALPHFVINGSKIAESNLVYKWKTNGTVQQSVSGYGKNTFVFQGSLIERPVKVEVEVTAINSPLIAKQSITLKSQNPEIVIYENNPLLGIVYEQAVLGEFLLERSQVDFEAIPYFFSANTKDDTNLNYRWLINGVYVATKPPTENYLLLQNTNNDEGLARISLTTKQNQNILQTIQTGLQLNFTKIKENQNKTQNDAITF